MNASALWNETKEYFRPGVKRCRLGMAALGVLVCALCISLMRVADFGVEPFQCLCNGLERVVPFSYGTMYLLLCIVCLIITLLLNPRYVGVTTMLNLFLIGYLVDLFDWLLRLAFPAPSVALRVVLLAVLYGQSGRIGLRFHRAASGGKESRAFPFLPHRHRPCLRAHRPRAGLCAGRRDADYGFLHGAADFALPR